jgi:hypothetical protein
MNTGQVIDAISGETGFDRAKSAKLLGAILGNIIKGTAETGECKIGICTFKKKKVNYKPGAKYSHNLINLPITIRPDYKIKTWWMRRIKKYFKQLDKVQA